MTGPGLDELFGLFPQAADRPAAQIVPSDDVPSPYRELLVHTEHMTVTVEAFHGESVHVRVLERLIDGDIYARRILLTLQSSGRVVQFGIVRIHLQFCSEPVRAAILAEQTPLGRILIENDVLRRIEPTAFLRVPPGPATAHWFGPPGAVHETYGRLGVIHCDDLPAIEVLEIVAPVAPEPPMGETCRPQNNAPPNYGS